MDLTGLFVFAAALAVAAASPGPTITALVARVLVRGTSGALAFMLGLQVGEIVWLTAAILGLAFIATTFGMLFLVLKYAGAAYLAYLPTRLVGSAQLSGPCPGAFLFWPQPYTT